MADLVDVLSRAAEELTAPRLALAARLRDAIERWIATERAVTTTRAIQVLKPGYVDPEADRNREAAVAELRKIVAEIDPPEPLPVKSPVIRRASTLDEQKAASVLLAEISRVSPHEPHDRLVPRLRLLVATARELLEPLNPSDETYCSVFDSLDFLRIAYRQSGARERICGLDFGESPQPWGELRLGAQRALNKALGKAADRELSHRPRLSAPLALVASAGKKR